MSSTDFLPTFPAKRLLTPVRCSIDDFFYVNYNLNLYRGCNHGCIYCDSRSACYHMDDFDTVRVKEDCLSRLDAELKVKREAGVVGMGAASDAYNRFERTHEITRSALKLLLRYGFGIGIPTKSDLMARDADIYAAIAKVAPVRLCYSISTADDALAAILEPGAPAPSKRFEAMRELSDAGLFVGTWLNPMLPFISDSVESVTRVLEETARAGGKYCITFFSVTLREGDREYFYGALDRAPSLAGIKEKYIRAYGLSYDCTVPNVAMLAREYERVCERLGLLWRFSDVNRAMLSLAPSQTRLF